MTRSILLILLLTLLLPACTTTSSSPTLTPSPLPTLIPLSPSPLPTASPPPPSPTPYPYESPDWFKDSTLYLIFVRSFADSNGDGIGDLNGITSRLDYLQSLGVNTLWLMPIFPSPSAHGYDVTDFTAINPEYGTLQDLQTLLQAAHARDMHIILDYVPSHLSNQNPIFQDAYNNPQSRYANWFVWTNDTHTRYAGFADLSEMPRFNHYEPEVVQYLTESALFWLDLDGDGDYTDGVDGFRIDNATFPPQEFFYAFRHSLKTANPNTLILGETWVTRVGDLARFFPNQFDALFDFPFYAQFQGNPEFNVDALLAGKGIPALLDVLIKDELKAYPPEGIPVRFLSNHDTNRIATEVEGNPARLRLAPVLLASFPGVPMLYYGEEIGMYGQKGGPPHWDNYRREPMDWYTAEQGEGQTTWFTPQDGWNKPNDGISVEEQDLDSGSLLNFYRRVFALRAENPALSRGGLQVLPLTVESAGPWGLLRQADAQMLVALFNFGDAAQTITVQAFPFDAPNGLTDLLTGETYPPATTGEPYTLPIPATIALWLIPTP